MGALGKVESRVVGRGAKGFNTGGLYVCLFGTAYAVTGAGFRVGQSSVSLCLPVIRKSASGDRWPAVGSRELVPDPDAIWLLWMISFSFAFLDGDEVARVFDAKRFFPGEFSCCMRFLATEDLFLISAGIFDGEFVVDRLGSGEFALDPHDSLRVGVSVVCGALDGGGVSVLPDGRGAAFSGVAVGWGTGTWMGAFSTVAS